MAGGRGGQVRRAGTCLTLAHTTDAGHIWATLPALPADLPVLGAGVRFADAQTGYLYSSTYLYTTADGGTTWNRQPYRADAIEVANGTAIRIASTATGCVPGCAYHILRAPIGSGQWTAVATPAVGGTGVQLLRTGHRAFAAWYGNSAGGAPASGALLTSTDDGATWTTRPDPCGTGQGARPWTVTATAPDPVLRGEVPPGVVGFETSRNGWWLPGRATVFATADAGRDWTPYRLTPP